MQIKAIIDIDCADLKGFDEDDQQALEGLADLIAKSCDFWSPSSLGLERLSLS